MKAAQDGKDVLEESYQRSGAEDHGAWQESRREMPSVNVNEAKKSEEVEAEAMPRL